MSKLADKIAVIIGGNGGIGGATSLRFQTEGAQVYATSRKVIEGADSTVGGGEGSIHAIRADASKPADLERVFAQVRLEKGRIDILVLNAGLSEFGTLGDISEDMFDRTFGLNVRSLLFAAQGAIEHMQSGATIVLVGSIADSIGTKGYGVYSATKAAVRSFARTWANKTPPTGNR